MCPNYLWTTQQLICRSENQRKKKKNPNKSPSDSFHFTQIHICFHLLRKNGSNGKLIYDTARKKDVSFL